MLAMTASEVVSYDMNITMTINSTSSSADTFPASSPETLVESSTSGLGREEDTHVPVVGLGTVIFPTIHGTALVSLSISILASVRVLVFMLLQREKKTLWSRTIAERLVIYLAVGDLLFSVTHAIDHATMLAIAGNPPRPACITIAFFMLSLYYSPSIIALFTAVNAFAMVVLKYRLNLGRYDWRLLLLAFAGPSVFMMVAASLRLLGASGIACSFYFGSAGGRLMGKIFSISMVIGFTINFTCYTLVWLRIRHSRVHTETGSTQSAANSTGRRFQRSARIMMVFVAAYFAQSWSVIIYYIWGFFSNPPLILVYLVVTFVNMGGVFNALAYTVLRKRFHILQSTSPPSSGAALTSRTTVTHASTGGIAPPIGKH